MMSILRSLLLLSCGSLLLSFFTCKGVSTKKAIKVDNIRFASYNVALFRAEAGQLAKDLESGTDPQIQNIAAVIQHVDADVIGLFEFDYDPDGQLLRDFQKNYLSISQHGQSAVNYPYQIQLPSNTGVLSGSDYNGDGKTELPNDAFGYGNYEGQYAFALLSKYPIDESQLRSFQMLLWSQLPEGKIPVNPDASPYYSSESWERFRLSSKNHVDVPVQLPNGKTIHTIMAHPTPPVFDGPEDRNGLRNYDEIRLIKDYIHNASYLTDDKGRSGGLPSTEAFVIMGDLNADPIDGDSYAGAINQLLDSDLVNSATAMGNKIPASKGGKVHNRGKGDKGDPAFDTAFFGKRIDYVLASKNMEVLDSGVFWPAEGEPLYDQVKNKNASDHLLVWVDLK